MASMDDFENSRFFHILGFDIMLDHKCKPYLLEVNHSPSFQTDSPLDEQVKGRLVLDSINMLGLSPQRKHGYQMNQLLLEQLKSMTGKFIHLSKE